MSEPCDVVLVSMPWTVTQSPSIQLGILTSLLRRSGMLVDAAHLYVAFFDEVARRLPGRRVAIETYNDFGEAVGEWTFSVPPFRTPDATSDAAWREIALAQHRAGWADLAFRVRELVPGFLERSAEELLGRRPRVVGFTSTFQQTVPSLALARILKQHDPSLRIVFGGANCEGGMGAALHRLFPWIDVVVRGEAEQVIPGLFRELVTGAPITARPGLCVREGVHAVVHEAMPSATKNVVKLGRSGAAPAEASPTAVMADVPVPTYDDYFARLHRSLLGEQIDKIWLPYESARGCWWAVTKVCTFCAANANYVTFRSKPSPQVKDEVESLSARYGSPYVWFVDNIMDEQYLRELFPAMRGNSRDMAMFVECRAHVSRAQLATMRDAGVVKVQLGVESFSSSILKLIDKGTTAIQNLRVLKWCAELGIHAFYNVIYGFPGEDPEDYDRMADLTPSLVHLEPPSTPVALRLDRFSPYFKDPDRFGITITGPRPSRVHVLGHDAEAIEPMEYFFMFDYLDGRKPSSYVGRFLEACRVWREDKRTNFGRLGWAYHGAGLRIHDLRSTGSHRSYLLGPIEARLYLGCDAGATAIALHAELPPSARTQFDVVAIERFLDELIARRLACRDGKKVLALAVDAAAPGIPAIASEEIAGLPTEWLALRAHMVAGATL
jgi:ribosomal peptide maturation radical SAM protein 1